MRTEAVLAIVVAAIAAAMAWNAFVEPKSTAQGVAIARFVATWEEDEQVRSPDSLAHIFVGRGVSFVASIAPLRWIATAYLHHFFPTLVPNMSARARFVDSSVLEATRAGASQVVTIAAGFDSRAYRPLLGEKEKLSPTAVKFFEIDIPKTQQLKRDRLAAAGIDSSHVTYLAIDLRHDLDKLIPKLRENGWDSKKRTVVLMEGLTVYLTPETLSKTLDVVAEICTPGSTLVTDYIDYAFSISPAGIVWQKYIAGLGEPSLGPLTPEDAEKTLEKHGFKVVDHPTEQEICDRFLRRKDGTHLCPLENGHTLENHLIKGVRK